MDIMQVTGPGPVVELLQSGRAVVFLQSDAMVELLVVAGRLASGDGARRDLLVWPKGSAPQPAHGDLGRHATVLAAPERVRLKRAALGVCS